MHPLTAISNAALEEQLTGMAVNRQQDRQLANRTAEIDSLAEILVALDACDSPAARRRLVVYGLKMLRQIRDLNDVEHGCEQRTAGHVGQITPALAAARRRWTIKRLATELRPLLGDLANPLITGDRERAKLAWLAQIIREAPPANLAAGSSLEGELGPGKWRFLRKLLDGAEARL